jgi:hypothetical protein
MLLGEGRAEAAEAGDDLVEDQEDAMLVADLAQALEIADRRDQGAGGACHRFDEAGGDGGAAIGLAVALEVIGQLDAVILGPAVAEELVAGEGVAQHHHVGHGDREGLAVLDHAGKRHTAHVDAVIGALAAHEAQALGLAAGPVIGHHHLQRGVDGLGAGVDEEHVVHRLGQQGRDLAGQLEGAVMAEAEGCRVGVGQQLLVDRVRDLGAAMAGGAAEERRRAVDHLAALVVGVVNALALGNQARVLLEITVAGERHPVLFERVRTGCVAKIRVMHRTTPV